MRKTVLITRNVQKSFKVAAKDRIMAWCPALELALETALELCDTFSKQVSLEASLTIPIGPWLLVIIMKSLETLVLILQRETAYSATSKNNNF